MKLNPTEVYQANIATYESELKSLKSRSLQFSVLRLIAALGAILLGYFWLQDSSPTLLASSLAAMVLFLYLIQKHDAINEAVLFKETLIQVNKDEVTYLMSNQPAWYDGTDFINTAHPYSFDLDVFGKDSLYAHLNRTHTTIGKQALADHFCRFKTNASILEHQEAVEELSRSADWRQQIQAKAAMANDSSSAFEWLQKWLSDTYKVPSVLVFSSYIATIMVTACWIVFIVTQDRNWINGALLGSLLNLSLIATQYRKINEELDGTLKAGKIIKRYASILSSIDAKDFEGKLLNDLKYELKTGGIHSSIRLKHFAGLLAKMEGIINMMGVFLNGLFCYHLHVFNRLCNWRNRYAHHCHDWLKVMGEIEALNSLATFGYNNPNFTYPSLTEEKFEFENLGHPLIFREVRICNDIAFARPYTILTGSNMSGKSTFLRTVGINLLLANIGAPICATKGTIVTMPLWISMRQSDSLSEGASYFYAEVLRLKAIIEQMRKEKTFVLLDEILRGTNSDDKRSGTIRILQQIQQIGAVGIIATHDLEVCEIEKKYPSFFSNKRFEGAIIENELVFDFKLLDGICESKSATFLLEKEGVVPPV